MNHRITEARVRVSQQYECWSVIGMVGDSTVGVGYLWLLCVVKRDRCVFKCVVKTVVCCEGDPRDRSDPVDRWWTGGARVPRTPRPPGGRDGHTKPTVTN